MAASSSSVALVWMPKWKSPRYRSIPANTASRFNSGSAGQNKAALRLAQKYGVSYDEIMRWKAEGHGFGEIDKAYGLLAKTKDQGTTVAGFFALRDGGKGWGQIAKIYGVSLKGNNGSGDKDDSHDNGGGHDHGHSHGEHRDAPKAAEPAEPAEAPRAAAKGPKKAAKAAAVSTVKVSYEDTPNPNARKFTCSVTVIEKGSLSFNETTEANSHPLGRTVWAVGNVKSIFAVKDFVTVIKTDEADWDALTGPVIAAIQQGLAERDA